MIKNLDFEGFFLDTRGNKIRRSSVKRKANRYELYIENPYKKEKDTFEKLLVLLYKIRETNLDRITDKELISRRGYGLTSIEREKMEDQKRKETMKPAKELMRYMLFMGSEIGYLSLKLRLLQKYWYVNARLFINKTNVGNLNNYRYKLITQQDRVYFSMLESVEQKKRNIINLFKKQYKLKNINNIFKKNILPFIDRHNIYITGLKFDEVYKDFSKVIVGDRTFLYNILSYKSLFNRKAILRVCNDIFTYDLLNEGLFGRLFRDRRSTYGGVRFKNLDNKFKIKRVKKIILEGGTFYKKKRGGFFVNVSGSLFYLKYNKHLRTFKRGIKCVSNPLLNLYRIFKFLRFYKVLRLNFFVISDITKLRTVFRDLRRVYLYLYSVLRLYIVRVFPTGNSRFIIRMLYISYFLYFLEKMLKRFLLIFRTLLFLKNQDLLIIFIKKVLLHEYTYIRYNKKIGFFLDLLKSGLKNNLSMPLNRLNETKVRCNELKKVEVGKIYIRNVGYMFVSKKIFNLIKKARIKYITIFLLKKLMKKYLKKVIKWKKKIILNKKGLKKLDFRFLMTKLLWLKNRRVFSIVFFLHLWINNEIRLYDELSVVKEYLVWDNYRVEFRLKSFYSQYFLITSLTRYKQVRYEYYLRRFARKRKVKYKHFMRILTSILFSKQTFYHRGLYHLKKVLFKKRLKKRRKLWRERCTLRKYKLIYYWKVLRKNIKYFMFLHKFKLKSRLLKYLRALLVNNKGNKYNGMRNNNSKKKIINRSGNSNIRGYKNRNINENVDRNIYLNRTNKSLVVSEKKLEEKKNNLLYRGANKNPSFGKEIKVGNTIIIGKHLVLKENKENKVNKSYVKENKSFIRTNKAYIEPSIRPLKKLYIKENKSYIKGRKYKGALSKEADLRDLKNRLLLQKMSQEERLFLQRYKKICLRTIFYMKLKSKKNKFKNRKIADLFLREYGILDYWVEKNKLMKVDKN